MSRDVLILGCGPAGLIAARAAESAGCRVYIAAKKRKSRMYGAQYLHEPIPEIDAGNPRMINYELVGSSTAYRYKVYGDMWDGSVSSETLMFRHYAWDIRKTYDALWERYMPIVEDVNITPMVLNQMIKEKFHLIVCTIPFDKLCTAGHSFRSQEIKAAGEAPDLGIEIPYKCPPETVICNGDKDISWYRISNVFGHKTIEWPSAINPPIPTAAVVHKPLDHNCNCYEGLLRVGRFGAWKKGYLVHHVYQDVQNELAERWNQR